MKKNIRIEEFTWEIEEIALTHSYKLSYQTLYSYKACITTIHLSDGSVLTGEVIPLIGYTDETLESVFDELEKIKSFILTQTIENVIVNLNNNINTDNAFAYSSVLPSMEEYLSPYKCKDIAAKTKDLVYAYDFTNYTTIVSIQKSIDKIKMQGYKTVKIKLGKNILKERSFLESLNEINLQGLNLRFDANGGYSLEETKSILSLMQTVNYANAIQYLEQPVKKKAWEEIEELCSLDSRIPIMIDESIYCLDDIKHCAKIGAKYIKLKLCKFGGLEKTQEALDYAVSLGLKVIFGNGVASDISNHQELCFYYKNKDILYDAVESVGFLKLKKNIKYNIKVRNEKYTS